MKTSLKQLGLTKKEVLKSSAICQTHFGDYLKKEINISDDEKYRIYQTNKENLPYTDILLTVEYFGIKNGYTWKTCKTYKK